MSDLYWNNISCVQSDKQLPPATIVSASTIVPTTKFSFITGVEIISIITPPVTGYHDLIFSFNGASIRISNGFTSGNIWQIGGEGNSIITPTPNGRIIYFYYNPSDRNYYTTNF